MENGELPGTLVNETKHLGEEEKDKVSSVAGPCAVPLNEDYSSNL